MEFGFSTLKTVTITYNVLSVVCGITLIILGVSNLDEAKDLNNITGNNIPTYLMIFLTILGICFITLRLIGFGGFCFTKKCLVWTYATVSLSLSTMLILTALIIYFTKNTFADLGYDRTIKFFFEYHREEIVHKLQEKYECCGALSPSYWIDLPDSCCLNQRCDILSTLLMGCAPRFRELILTSASVIQWTSIGVSVAGLFGVILSYWIWSQHNSQKDPDEEESETT
ncbi:uncharacterized protein LOC134828430 [Culicoides brevitarsis]|uniref:uncharacterized protein LOC134828430 n=1 Tax=Culicoides brevitarsis TaxID=469753 RepID=UPI00307B1A85